MSNIRLSPKHGLNPSLTTCFWCGKDIGVALFGRLPNDKEAPRHVVTDYDPCDTCKAGMASGFTFIEARPVPAAEGLPLMGRDDQGVPMFPTGRMFVITHKAAARILGPGVTSATNVALIDIETFDALMPEEATP